MRDLQKYWQEIRTLENSLPDSVWLVSLEDGKRGMRGGRLVEATAETAAKLLHSNSHRRATDEEIEAHRSQQAEAQRAAFHARLRMKGIAVVPVAKQD
jgi:Tfp pilus assembly protein PilN